MARDTGSRQKLGENMRAAWRPQAATAIRLRAVPATRSSCRGPEGRGSCRALQDAPCGRVLRTALAALARMLAFVFELISTPRYYRVGLYPRA
ncbi:MAG: hypothetical protein ACI8UR_001241 [Natronomonas sp.]|jgi:hypothetical protein